MNKELFEKILKTPSISGKELYMQKLLINELKDIDDEVITHHSYNTIHVINKDAKVKVLLAAHIDEIGLIIDDILPNGICKLTNVGAIRPEMYLGQRVNVVIFENGSYHYIPGVISYQANANNTKPETSDLILDLGTLSKEETLNLVSIGDVVIHQDNVTYLENNLISSRALDDKIATFICCEVLKRLKNKTNNGVYFASTVGEETTGRGSVFTTSMVNPTLAIILDVGSSSDVQYYRVGNRNVSLGHGPMFTIASNGNEILTDLLKKTANENHIPYQEVVEYSKTYTDFDTIYKQNNGIPSTLISIPLRYMHSSVEVGSLTDVEYIIELLVEFIKNLDETISFDPFK